MALAAHVHASERDPLEWSAIKVDQSKSLAEQDLGVIVLSVDFQLSGGGSWQRFHDLNAYQAILIGRQARFSRDKYFRFMSEIAVIRHATADEHRSLKADLDRDTPVRQGIAVDLLHDRAAYAIRPGTYVLMDIHAGIDAVDRKSIGNHVWDQQNAGTSLRFTVKAGEVAYLGQLKIVVPIAAGNAANGGEVLDVTVEDHLQQDHVQLEKAVRKIVGSARPIALIDTPIVSPASRFPVDNELRPPAPLTPSQIDAAGKHPPR